MAINNHAFTLDKELRDHSCWCSRGQEWTEFRSAAYKVAFAFCNIFLSVPLTCSYSVTKFIDIRFMNKLEKIKVYENSLIVQCGSSALLFCIQV